MSGTPVLLDIYAAHRRLRRYLTRTPLIRSEWLSSVADAEVCLKIESLQLSRSFKIRGALNALLTISDRAGAARIPTIVTASAGNHGRALALAGEMLGLRVVVFTPQTAPETKKVAIRRHGAELRDDPPDYDAAEREARAYAASEGALYVSPYNDADVIAGAGTIALEILEILPQLDVLVVPLGGGGLASGLALALKNIAPGVRVIGVEVEASTPFATGIARGAITEIAPRTSLADGLTGNLERGSMTFDIVRAHVDAFVSVSESDLERAMRGLAAEDHLIAEGAGATATAAVIAGRAVEPGQKAVVMLTGGNIDLEKFAKVICS
ncbi:MAG TPA: pyridoxal-phosphate dependent enzyme [Vicinamibacterales bacterium]|nr:pyridoxal-phosphate dependent enzyme [Vicinamibacterales bacterium]